MRRLIIGAACILAVLSATNQPQALAQMNPIAFEEYDLPNGLHVILSADKSAPVAATVVHYRVGCRDEDPHRTGFAHFFEHLMFEGTKDIPRGAISKYIESVGGRLNAYTSVDETVYHNEVPANEIRLPLWIEAQRMRGLLVDATGVETQRGVVKEERRVRYENSPYGSWNELTTKYLFAGSNYEWTPIGSSQHIDSASIDEFRHFYDTYYQPSNATLTVVGDFSVPDVKKYIQDYFGWMSRGPAIKRKEFNLQPMQGVERETIEDAKAQLPAVYMSMRGPKIGDPDAYAMNMLMDLLGSGESSRLYRRLVDKDQAAVQTASFLWDMEYAGRISFIGIAAPGKSTGDVERLIIEEIEKMKKDGVTDEEFRKAKNIQEARFLYGKKDVLEKAQALSKYYTYFGKTNLINNELEQYMKVTKKDLLRVARQYLTLDKYVVLSYIPKS